MAAAAAAPSGAAPSPASGWAQHAKHALIVTSAGKPVWSLRGSEDELAALAPIVQAVLARAEDSGEALEALHLSDGALLLAASRGPLHCALLARTGECAHALRQQLRLLHAYLLFATLPAGSLPAALAARPGLDARPQCEGVARGMRSALAAAEASPAAAADAYALAALGGSGGGGGGGGEGGLRARLAAALGAGGRALGDGGQLLYALLLEVGGGSGGSVVAWAQQPGTPLRPSDLHCLAAFAGGCPALMGGSGDVWVTCGLPGLSVTGTVQVLLRRVGSGSSGAGAGAGAAAAAAPLPPLTVLASPLEPGEGGAGEGGEAGGPVGEGAGAGEGVGEGGAQLQPLLVLALVLIGGVPEAAQRRAGAIERALHEACPGLALAQRPEAAAAAVEALQGALGLAQPPPPGSPTLLRWGYLGKPARPGAAGGAWPAAWGSVGGGSEGGGGGRRAAAAAALARVYSDVCAPPARGVAAAAQWGSAGGMAAAVHSSNAVVVALWGVSGGGREGVEGGSALPLERVAGLMERLAKALGKAHDRLLLLPGPAKIL